MMQMKTMTMAILERQSAGEQGGHLEWITTPGALQRDFPMLPNSPQPATHGY